jgi:hypothetical protein
LAVIQNTFRAGDADKNWGPAGMRQRAPEPVVEPVYPFEFGISHNTGLMHVTAAREACYAGREFVSGVNSGQNALALASASRPPGFM